jgi:hypothetical protein
MAFDPFTFDERGQICDLIDRPLLPTHAKSHCIHDFREKSVRGKWPRMHLPPPSPMAMPHLGSSITTF